MQAQTHTSHQCAGLTKALLNYTSIHQETKLSQYWVKEHKLSSLQLKAPYLPQLAEYYTAHNTVTDPVM